MQLSQALDIINAHAPQRIDSLHDLLPADLISQALAQTDTVTFRKRKLPLESMVWLLIGMAIYNDKSMADIVNTMDIVNSVGKPFVAPSAVIQRRQSLREDAVRLLFEKTQAHWHQQANHPLFCGLTLLGVDGVVWRTPDTPENSQTFSRQVIAGKPSEYPQIRMVC